MKPGAAALACAFFLLAAGATARAETPLYLGTWTVVSVEPGVWTNGYYEADKLAETRKLVDAPVTFGPHSVDGPPPLACPRAQYHLDGATAHDLFDEKLVQVYSSQTPSPEESDPSGEYFAPEVLAARMGFRGFSWKSLTTGCAMDGTGQIYFSSADSAAFRIGDFVVTMKRK